MSLRQEELRLHSFYTEADDLLEAAKYRGIGARLPQPHAASLAHGQRSSNPTEYGGWMTEGYDETEELLQKVDARLAARQGSPQRPPFNPGRGTIRTQSETTLNSELRAEFVTGFPEP